MPMSDQAIDPKYLEIFPSWLRSLGEDAGALGEIVAGDASDDVKRHAVSGLNYLFKSLDLIPDGIDDLGFLDDAFVLRVAAAHAVAAEPAAKAGVLGRLADDAAALKEFLGDDFTRLDTYVNGLKKGAARGRTVEDVMTDAAAKSAFLSEVSAWAKEYQAPTFTRDVKTLLKLKSFLNAKLP
jgi:Protein of unknown function (DUF1232)